MPYLDCRMSRQTNIFIDKMEQIGYSRHYWIQTRSALKSFTTHCHSRGVGSALKVGPEECLTFIEKYRAQSLSYQRGVWTMVRQFLASEGNPVCMTLRPRLRGTSRTTLIWLSAEEAATIRDLDKTPNEELLIGGSLDQGLRRIETLRLSRADVETALQTNLLRVHGKTGERSIWLNPRFKKTLADYLSKLEASRAQDKIIPVGLTRSDDILDNFRKRYDRRRFGYHSLRRRCLTDLYESGTDLTIIARIAGHSSTAQTEEYLGIPEAAMREAWEKAEAFRNREKEQMRRPEGSQIQVLTGVDSTVFAEERRYRGV